MAEHRTMAGRAARALAGFLLALSAVASAVPAHAEEAPVPPAPAVEEPPADEAVDEPAGPDEEAPADEGAAADEAEVPDPEPSSGPELVDRRTETSKTFATDDPGVYRTEVYAEPVHLRAGDGTWEELDPSLVPVGDGFASEGTIAPVAVVPEDGATAVAVDLAGGASVGFTLASDEVAREGDDAVTVAEVAEGVDAELEVLPNGVKETLVLADADAPVRYLFPLALDGVEAVVAPGGSVELVDAAGTVVGRIPAGWMADSSAHPETGEPATSMGVTYSLVAGPEGPSLQVDLDAAWLQAPERVFPVLVDPSVLQAGGGVDDTYVMAFSSGDRSAQGELQVGNNGFLGTRSFIHFPTLSTLASKRIHHAQLKLFQTGGGSCTATPMDIYPVTAAWSGPLTTTYGGPAVAASPVAAITSGVATGCAQAWVAADVSGVVADWSAGTLANNGLGFRARDEFATAQFKRFASSNSLAPPHIQVVWSDVVANPPSVPTQIAPVGEVGTLTPTLSAGYADPQSRPGKVSFVLVGPDGLAVALGEGSVVAPGSRSQWKVPAEAPLVAGRLYTIKAFSETTTGVASANAASVTFTAGSTTCHALGCEYDPTTLTIPGNPTLEQALTECEGEPATLGFGWATTGPSAGVTYRGTEGRDVVVVTSGPVRFESLGGDDLVCLPTTGFTNGTSPIATVVTGAGDDRAVSAGGTLRLTFRGDDGDDEAVGSGANDDLGGGAGADTLDAGVGHDTITGGDGADTITGGDGNETVDGGAGPDLITTGSGADDVLGGLGMDEIDGGIGVDEIDGGGDGDLVSGGTGNDILLGGDGNDRMMGGDGADDLGGGAGDDHLVGDPQVDDCDGGSGGEVDGDTAFTCETVTGIEHQDMRLLSPSNGEKVFDEAAIAVEYPAGPAPVAVRVSIGATVLDELPARARAGTVDLTGQTPGPLTLTVELVDGTGTVVADTEVDVVLELPAVDDLPTELQTRYGNGQLTIDELVVSGAVALASDGQMGTEDILAHFLPNRGRASWDAQEAIDALNTAGAASISAGDDEPLARDVEGCESQHRTWLLADIRNNRFCDVRVTPEDLDPDYDLPAPANELFEVQYWVAPGHDLVDDSPDDGIPDSLVSTTLVLWRAQVLYQQRGFLLPEAHRPSDGNVPLNVFIMDTSESDGILGAWERGFSSPELVYDDEADEPDGVLDLGHPIRIDGTPDVDNGNEIDIDNDNLNDDHRRELTHELFHTFEWNNISWWDDVGDVLFTSHALETVAFYESAASWGTQEYSSRYGHGWAYDADLAAEHWLADPWKQFLSGAGNRFLVRNGAYAWFMALEWLDEHGGEAGEVSTSHLLDRAFARYNHQRKGTDPVNLIEDQIDEGQWGSSSDEGLSRAWPRMWAALYIMGDGADNPAFDSHEWRWAQFWESEPNDWRDKLNVNPATESDTFGPARPAQIESPRTLTGQGDSDESPLTAVAEGGASFQDYWMPPDSQGEVELVVDPMFRDDKYGAVAISWEDGPDGKVCLAPGGEPEIKIAESKTEEDGSIRFEMPYDPDCPKVTLGVVHIDPNSSQADDFTLSAEVLSAEDPPPVNIDRPEIRKFHTGDGRPTMIIESTGTWTPDATTFMYRWLECDAGGFDCSQITDEFSDCFPSQHSLIGSTVRLELRGIGTGGMSEPVRSNFLEVESADFALLADPDGPSVYEMGPPMMPAPRTLVSRDENGDPVPHGAFNTTISGNGRVLQAVGTPRRVWDTQTQRPLAADVSGIGGWTALSSSGRYMIATGLGGAAINDLACEGSRPISDPRVNNAPPGFWITNQPAITPDGREVVFSVSDDGSFAGEDFSEDRSTVFKFHVSIGELELVSAVDGEVPAVGDSGSPDLSADGRYVAYWTNSEELGADPDTGGSQAVVTDTHTGDTTVVSRSIPHRTDGTVIEGSPAHFLGEQRIDISDDGTYVAYTASGWFSDGAGDRRLESRVYRVPREAGAPTLINPTPHLTPAGWNALSGDGLWMAFTSSEAIVAADTNDLCDTYLTQVGSGTFTLVSQGNDGTIGDDRGCSSGSPPAISTSGRYVGYSSEASNLYVGDPDPDDGDSWLYDRLHA